MELKQGFAYQPLPGVQKPSHIPYPPIKSPLGPLLHLVGHWHGTGFNTIWRPHNPRSPQDRFLELNLTNETLEFDIIPGEIPNRGLAQPDIVMFGVHYLQQISDAGNDAGLHLEPGIWAVVPQTTDPAEQSTVVRMASIPHGTTILAQGLATRTSGAPTIPDNDIIPFGLNGNPPAKGTFGQAEATFGELNLGAVSQFRTPTDAASQPHVPGLGTITQEMVQNPNSVLQAKIAGQTIRETVTLRISTGSDPVPGGGTANTEFLTNPNNPSDANAACNLVDATFWIEIVERPHRRPFLQLQYSQTVMLDFNGLRWPHVTVATLRKHLQVPVPAQSVDPDIPQHLVTEADDGRLT